MTYFASGEDHNDEEEERVRQSQEEEEVAPEDMGGHGDGPDTGRHRDQSPHRKKLVFGEGDGTLSTLEGSPRSPTPPPPFEPSKVKVANRLRK